MGYWICLDAYDIEDYIHHRQLALSGAIFNSLQKSDRSRIPAAHPRQ
jgi:hypothetical protein